MENKELKEEFFRYWLSNENLTSSDAADWWLSKLQETKQQEREEMAKLVEDLEMEGNFNIQHFRYCEAGYKLAKSDMLNKLKAAKLILEEK